MPVSIDTYGFHKTAEDISERHHDFFFQKSATWIKTNSAQARSTSPFSRDIHILFACPILVQAYKCKFRFRQLRKEAEEEIFLMYQEFLLLLQRRRGIGKP